MASRIKNIIEETYNVELRIPNENEYEIIQEALKDVTRLTQMYYPDVVVPIVFEVYITSRDICSINAMSYYSENKTIVLTPRVLRGTYNEMRATILHEFVHLVAHTTEISNPYEHFDTEIQEGLTELCSREIQRTELGKIISTVGYNEYVNYVTNEIYKNGTDISTATTAYLNPKENERFLNEVFPL